MSEKEVNLVSRKYMELKRHIDKLEEKIDKIGNKILNITGNSDLFLECKMLERRILDLEMKILKEEIENGKTKT